MILIRNVESYKDGGSIGIYGGIDTDDVKIMPSDHIPMITVDFSFTAETPGKWFFGRKKDGRPIEDQELISKVKEALKEWHYYNQSIIEDII